MTIVIKPDRVLDCRGQFCPAPVLRVREEIDRMESGQVLQVLASDPAAREDISRWAKRTGHELLEIREEGGELAFLLRRS